MEVPVGEQSYFTPDIRPVSSSGRHGETEGRRRRRSAVSVTSLAAVIKCTEGEGSFWFPVPW